MNDKRFEEGLEEQSEKALMESESGIEAQKAETQAAAEEEEKPEKKPKGASKKAKTKTTAAKAA